MSKFFVSRALLAMVGAATFAGTSLAQQSEQTPRLANGRPDLNGVWFGGFQPALNAPTDGVSVCLFGCDDIQSDTPPGGIGTPPPDRPTYKPEFQAKVDDLNERQVLEDPVLNCSNPGVPRIGAPDKIIQTEREAVFLYDDVNGAFWRIIPLDGRSHREDVEPTFLGESVGHWDGDTLVVESVKFNDEFWLTDDGAFHSEGLRVVERLTRTGEELHWQATAYDPDVLAEPWVRRPVIATLSGNELYESPPCIDHDLPLMQDLSSHDNPR